jgi:hypothetical protein
MTLEPLRQLQAAVAHAGAQLDVLDDDELRDIIRWCTILRTAARNRLIARLAGGTEPESHLS